MDITFSSYLSLNSRLSALPCNLLPPSTSPSPAPYPHHPSPPRFPLPFVQKINSCQRYSRRFHSDSSTHLTPPFLNGVARDLCPAPASRILDYASSSRRRAAGGGWVLKNLRTKCCQSRAADLLFDLSVSHGEALAEEESAVGGGEVATYTVLSFLAVAAFLALLTLTVGVVYLAVSDFMEKRSIDAQTKDAELKKKKKKNTEEEDNDARIRPKGFGLKVRKAK